MLPMATPARRALQRVLSAAFRAGAAGAMQVARKTKMRALSVGCDV
jgi:hypothetical protein